ncbi:hypothetical protein HNY73_014442 [Argiope bruennichi]|uniref:Uncharacterized protein n=1 Tax=Argiope bruennichi TaxID=94029 RepID=A0A8T0EQF3_ARGBR|nr:hypothetical protein HNY73_014442 [Argiope bruennichi]
MKKAWFDESMKEIDYHWKKITSRRTLHESFAILPFKENGKKRILTSVHCRYTDESCLMMESGHLDGRSLANSLIPMPISRFPIAAEWEMVHGME